MYRWLIISNVVLWIIIIIQLIFMYKMAKSLTEFLNRFRIMNGRVQPKKTLKIGGKSPVFKIKDNAGRKILINHQSNFDVVMLFTKSGCSICSDIFDNFERYTNILGNSIKILVIGEETNKKIEDFQENNNIHVVKNANLIQLFEVEFVPYLVIIDKNGTILDLQTISGIDDLIKHTRKLDKKRAIN